MSQWNPTRGEIWSEAPGILFVLMWYAESNRALNGGLLSNTGTSSRIPYIRLRRGLTVHWSCRYPEYCEARGRTEPSPWSGTPMMYDAGVLASKLSRLEKLQTPYDDCVNRLRNE